MQSWDRMEQENQRFLRRYRPHRYEVTKEKSY